MMDHPSQHTPPGQDSFKHVNTYGPRFRDSQAYPKLGSPGKKRCCNKGTLLWVGYFIGNLEKTRRRGLGGAGLVGL